MASMADKAELFYKIWRGAAINKLHHAKSNGAALASAKALACQPMALWYLKKWLCNQSQSHCWLIIGGVLQSVAAGYLVWRISFSQCKWPLAESWLTWLARSISLARGNLKVASNISVAYLESSWRIYYAMVILTRNGQCQCEMKCIQKAGLSTMKYNMTSICGIAYC